MLRGRERVAEAMTRMVLRDRVTDREGSKNDGCG